MNKSFAFRESLTTCALIVPLFLVAKYWADLPDVIPIHFGFRGQPDNWGSKWWVTLIPAVSLATWALMVTVRRFPHRFNYPIEITSANRERQQMLAINLLDWLRLETTFLFASITWLQINIALGRSEGLGVWFVPGTIAVLVITIWIYFKAVRRGTARERL